MSELTTTIKFDIDESSANKAKKEASEVSKALGEAIGSQSLREQKAYADAVESSTRELADLRKELMEATEAQERLNASAKQYEPPSSDGGIDIGEGAGRASTGLSQIGSAVGALGGGSGLADLGDIVGSLESIENLKGAIGALGGVSASSVVALGAVGIAFAAVTLALQNFTEQAQAQADQINSIIEAGRSVDADIVGGLDEQGAQAKVANAQLSLELEASRLELLKAQYAEMETQAGALSGIIKAISPQEQALADQIAKSEEIINNTRSEIDAYNQALEQGKFKATEATPEVEKLNQALGNTSSNASSASDAVKNQEKANAKAQADAEKAQQKAQQEREKAQQEAQQKAQKAADSAKKYKESLEDIDKTYAESVANAKTKLKEGIKDLNAKFAQDLNDGAIKFNQEQAKYTQDRYRQEQDALRDFNRTIEDINRDAFNSEEEARNSRNILQIAQLRKNQQKQLEDAARDQARGKSDRAEDEKRARADALQAYDQERQDRKRALNRSLVDAQEAYKKDLVSADQARKKSIESANIARKRELESLNSHLQGMLDLRGQYYAKEKAQLQSVLGGGSGGGGGTKSGYQPSVSGNIPAISAGMKRPAGFDNSAKSEQYNNAVKLLRQVGYRK